MLPVSPENVKVTTVTRQTSWLRWIGIGIGVILLLVYGPVAVFKFRFRESPLKGASAPEIIARFGPPDYASSTGAEVAGEPLWTRMTESGQAELLARPEFRFGYFGPLGEGASMRFMNGRVVEVVTVSK